MTDLTKQLDLRAPIEPRPTGCHVPLTAEQRRLYQALERQDPEHRPRNVRMCASAVRASGPLDVELLRASIEAVVRRHESLRTRFIASGTTQHIDAPSTYELGVVDLSGLPEVEADRAARLRAQEFQDQRIDLSVGPLFEAKVFKLSANQNALVMLIDHMVSDGMSNALLNKEIWTTYDEALRGSPPSLPCLQLQFADYVVWQQQTHDSWKQQHEKYWREHLATARHAAIPSFRGPSKAKPAAGVTLHFPIPAKLSERLREIAKLEQVSTADAILTAYAVAMSHWCEQEDLLIRCPVHGRHGRPELEDMIGFIVNRLYLRIKVRRQDSLGDLLLQAHAEMKCALQHRDFDRAPEFAPECLMTELEFHWRPARWPGRPSNAQQGAIQQVRRQPFLIRLPDWPGRFWSVFDDTPAGICATVHYWPHLVAPEDVHEFGRNLQALVAALVDRPGARVHSVLPGTASA